MELLPHFSHEKHPFILKNLPKQDHSGYGGDGDGDGGGHSDSDSDGGGGGDGGGYGDSGGDGGGNRELLDHICKGCNEQISLYDEPYCYRCEECDYDLHKLCAEAPLTIQHHSHYEHPLHLCDRSKILREILPTRCCRDDWPTGLCYYCDSCEFLVDIICATAGERKVYNPHHHHRLSRFRTPFWAKCNACGIRNEAVFLQCTMCLDFWLHEYCALLPKQILIQQVDPGGDNRYHHAHPLTIEYGLLDRHARHFPDCRVCKAEIDRDLWIYSCERCRYFVHVNCNNIKHEDLDFMALSGSRINFVSIKLLHMTLMELKHRIKLLEIWIKQEKEAIAQKSLWRLNHPNQNTGIHSIRNQMKLSSQFSQSISKRCCYRLW